MRHLAIQSLWTPFDMDLSRNIAAQATACSWATLPEKVQNAARLALADGLAVMRAALEHEPATHPFQAHARALGGQGATLLSGGVTAPPNAALANGALAHALDFEDTFDAAGLHVNAAVIPTILALAESKGVSLGDVLTAITLGADLACRLGLSLTSNPSDRGWYFPPMIGACGAAFAGSHLLGLSPAQTASALSLTQTQFALTDALKHDTDTDLRAVRDGFAARAATEAVMLAAAGVKGTSDPLADVGGIVHIMTGAAPDITAFDGFGVRFATPDLSVKLWPACRGTHQAIALALALKDARTTASDLESVAFTVRPPDDMLFEPRAHRVAPNSAIAAKFSIPFCFSAALLNGPPTLASFSEKAREERATLDLASRISMEICDRAAIPAARITFADGRVERHLLPPAPKLNYAMLNFATLTPKLRDCVGHSDALDALRSLETAAPETPVTSCMTRFCSAQTC